MSNISIFTLQQLLLCLHLLVTAELSSLFPEPQQCSPDSLHTSFPLARCRPRVPLELGHVSSEGVVSHIVAVLTTFHTPLGPALVSGTTSQSCLPSWQKQLFYTWVHLNCISADWGLLGIVTRRGESAPYMYSFKFLPCYVCDPSVLLFQGH